MEKLLMRLLNLTFLLAVGMAMTACGDDNEDDDFVGRETDGSVTSGTPGTQDMFGYYSDGRIWEEANERAEILVSTGNTNKQNWEDLYFHNVAYRIVDGYTIYPVYEGVSIDKPSDDAIIIHTKSHTVSWKATYTYTLYHYMYSVPDVGYWHGVYSMNGDKMNIITEDGDVFEFTYSSGQIVTNDRRYTKVK